MSEKSYPIGPIWQAVLKGIWAKLFDSSSSLYLPNIIRKGDPSLNLPSYDPATFTGKSKAFPILGVEPSVMSQACQDDTSPIPPKGTDPTLNLGAVMIENLSNMSPVSMTFSREDPNVTIEVNVGTPENQFVLKATDATTPNFYFDVHCCSPESSGSDKCSREWDTSAKGQFVAKVSKFDITIVSRLNTPVNSPPTITILEVDLSLDSKNLDINFNVDSLPDWAKSLVEIAVQQGINTNAMQNIIQSFLNQDSVKGNIETLINDQLKKIWGDNMKKVS